MAHEMTKDDRMFSVRIAPWHMGQGTNVNILEAVPENRAERMMQAGHDFMVEENDVHYKVERSDEGSALVRVTFPKLPGYKMLTRSDTGLIFAVLNDTYEVAQNVVLHELFEALAGQAVLTDATGGTVRGGALCYLSALIDEPVLVNGDNSYTYPFLVVTTAHDGSGSMAARRTSYRPVCANTVSAGELEGERTGLSYTFRHTKNMAARIEDAKRIIAGVREDTSAWVELANELAALPVTDTQRELFITTFIPAPVGQVVSDRVLDNISTARAKVRGVFDSDTIPEAHRNTAYGLVQAGVEYLDHLRGVRNQDTYLGRTLLRPEPLKAKLVPMVRELVSA